MIWLLVLATIWTLLAACWTVAWLLPPDQGESRLERITRGKEH